MFSFAAWFVTQQCLEHSSVRIDFIADVYLMDAERMLEKDAVLNVSLISS